MPTIQTTVECPVDLASFRVRQVLGMFDLRPERTSRQTFCVEVPGREEPWQIGVIVGPSGSGKTTVARAAFGDAFYVPSDWPSDKAVIDAMTDDLADRPIKEITAALTAVGFSSPPAWLRPYHVLSGGEKFRCELARALLTGGELVAFDEFTSVVDRTVAKIGSAAVAKAVRGPPSDPPVSPLRKGGMLRKLVAVTCHYDVVEWLEPDWVLDMATGQLARAWLAGGRLRRPPIALELFRCRREVWKMFAKHHYLSGSLAPGCRCYAATWAGEPVAFAAILRAVGRQRVWRISRVVVLPDFQGIGIGSRLCAELGEMYFGDGERLTITTSHPAMIAHLKRSRLWRVRKVSLGGNDWGRRLRVNTDSRGRTVVSAEYMPPTSGIRIDT